MNDQKVPIGMHIFFQIWMYYSLHAYLFWHIADSFYIILTFFTVTFLLMQRWQYFQFNRIGIILPAIVGALLTARGGNIYNYLRTLSMILPFVLFVFLKDKYKSDVYEKFKKGLILLLLVSFIAWILNQLGLRWISFLDGYGMSDDFDYQYLFNNHIFFVECLYQYNGETSSRFQSVFLEPSIIACLIVVVLYIEKFKFKKNYANILLLVVLLFSYSLAGYILLGIFYTVSKLESSKYKIGAIATIVFIAICIYAYGTYVNNGNNDINEKILVRLEYEDDTEQIEGYNRTTADFDVFFERHFNEKCFLFGDIQTYRKHFDRTSNVGWKPFLFKYGLITLLFYILFLYSAFKYLSRKSYQGIGFMALYVMIFIRGDYLMWLSAFMILYIYGHYRLSYNKDC